MNGGRPAAVGLGRVLYISAFAVATAGLVYELVAGALASYLLGDSVTQFSLIIGTYLSAMGVGAYLSKYAERSLVQRFVEIELAVALVGGFEAPILYGAFAWAPVFRPVLYAMVAAIGVLVGVELPLLLRILERDHGLKDLVARVLFLDYIGALAASLLFPLLLIPRLGVLRTSIVFGILNAAVALWTTSVLPSPPAIRRRLQAMATVVLALLVGGLVSASRMEHALDTALYADDVVFRERSPYQQIVVTRAGHDTRLFLNGALQFSTMDEYRYHEALVHPVMATVPDPQRVLVLGGGDGLAVREVLRHRAVQAVTLVDLDPAVTGLFTDRDELAALNAGSLRDDRVHVVNADALTWLGDAPREAFDVVIVDFPDPHDYAVGKLYTTTFYELVGRVLAPGGALAVQSTSPLFSPEAYWCIARTIAHTGLDVRPYHAYIPSFGEWGYVLASRSGPRAFGPLPPDLRFLDDATLPTLFVFPPDMRRPDGPINRLDNQVLVRLYEQDWRTMASYGP